jgi:hypothetical protein
VNDWRISWTRLYTILERDKATRTRLPITNAELVRGLPWPSHNSFTLELAADSRQNDKREVSGGVKTACLQVVQCSAGKKFSPAGHFACSLVIICSI